MITTMAGTLPDGEGDENKVSIYNEYLQDVIEPAIAAAQSPPRCSIYHNANQAIASGSYVVSSFNSERIDTEGMHDNVTLNSRITIRTAGDFGGRVGIAFAANATGFRGVKIRLNNTTDLVVVHCPAVASGGIETVLVASFGPRTFIVGDYLEVFVMQDSGGSLNLNSSSAYSPEFSDWRMG